jgi:VanZ family protein
MQFKYSWPALLWSLIVLVLTLMPGQELPKVNFFQIDKLVHFLVFGIMMILSSYALQKTKDKTGKHANPLLIACLYSTGFGIMIEVLQRFVPGRNFSLADVLANSIGVGLGYLIFIFFKKRKLV